MIEIFEEEESCHQNSSSGMTTAGTTTASSADGDRAALRNQGLTPVGSASTHRREIQLEVENLREEMSNMALEAPTWQMHKQIGKGAFGVVYRGTWRGLDVSIKRTIFQVGFVLREDKPEGFI